MYDLDVNENEKDDWIDKWFKPYDPRGEGIEVNMAEDGKDERTGEEEQERCEGDRFDKLVRLSDPEEGEAQEEREEDTTEGEREEEPEEARKARGVKAPAKPSKEEVDEHMLTHLPFRSWCPHCVRGKSKGKPHRKTAREHREIPTLALDYTFMHETQHKHEEKGMPILVIKDLRQETTGTGMIFAHVVPQKGVQPFAVKTLAGAIAQLGHQEIVLKSDGEPAITALKEAAKQRAQRENSH